METSRPPTYRIRRAAPEDGPALARLLDQNLSGRGARRLAWFADDPPQAPVTCLSETEDPAEAVGSASLLPVDVKAGESAVRAAIAVDFNVAAAHRGFGPALKLQRTLLDAGREAGLVATLGFPNEASGLMFRRVGYKEIAKARGWAKVLRSRYVVGRYLKTDVLATPAGAVLDVVLAVRDRLASRRPALGPVRARTLDAADARFDDLWTRARGLAPNLIQRSASFLNWRYLRSPLWPFRLFVLEDADGARIRGYIVFHLDEPSLVVDDFFYEDLPGVGSFLFRQFFIEARRTPARAVTLLAIENERTGAFLQSLGFVPRDRTRAILGYCAPSAVPPPGWFEKEAWHLTDGDLDL